MSLDTRNVSKTMYRKMVKELLPELSQSTNYTSVQKTLMFPVIKDELNLIIRNGNDTGSIHELTDKMFDKLVRGQKNKSLISFIISYTLNINS